MPRVIDLILDEIKWVLEKYLIQYTIGEDDDDYIIRIKKSDYLENTTIIKRVDEK